MNTTMYLKRHLGGLKDEQKWGGTEIEYGAGGCLDEVTVEFDLTMN